MEEAEPGGEDGMKLAKNVEDYIQQRADCLSSSFIDLCTETLQEPYIENGRMIESPLEQIFIVEWKFQEHERQGEYHFELFPQFGDPELTGKYFIDFAIRFLEDAIDRFDINALHSVREPLLGIEIDGHEFHEKTKRQVEYQKERERFLVSKGWRLLRFAGTEVFHDPVKCVNEAVKLAYEMRRVYFDALAEKGQGQNG